jgi:hypothetical protein
MTSISAVDKWWRYAGVTMYVMFVCMYGRTNVCMYVSMCVCVCVCARARVYIVIIRFMWQSAKN